MLILQGELVAALSKANKTDKRKCSQSEICWVGEWNKGGCLRGWGRPRTHISASLQGGIRGCCLLCKMKRGLLSPNNANKEEQIRAKVAKRLLFYCRNICWTRWEAINLRLYEVIVILSLKLSVLSSLLCKYNQILSLFPPRVKPWWICDCL